VRATNYNHCKVYWISLVLIVGVNILGVKCDIKTDFPKSGHIFHQTLKLCKGSDTARLCPTTVHRGIEMGHLAKICVLLKIQGSDHK